MSCPQHVGDLIRPCPLGHSDTLTVLPSSLVSSLNSSSELHLPHVMPITSMEQSEQMYFDNGDSSQIMGFVFHGRTLILRLGPVN
jgi:hypothetical protein